MTVLSGCTTHYQLPPAVAQCRVGNHTFVAHVAATDTARRKGFAGATRRVIKHAAILFVYPANERAFSTRHFSLGGINNSQSNWSVVHWAYNMRDMAASLDVAFLNSNGRVQQVTRMKPSMLQYRPRKPYSAVLELAAGRASQLSLEPDTVVHCRSVSSQQKEHRNKSPD